jgi:uncharacterized membrane protein
MAGLAAVSPALTITQTLTRLRRVRVSIGLLISAMVGIGILLRLAAWRFDRSLWLDEVYLALNITGRSFAELWKPLDHDQGAPVGFLMLVKLTTTLFGSSEMALRAVPLLAGIGSTLLFPQVARRLLPAPAVLFATALFAFTPKLVYYSSELKQYSSDVFVTLILLALVLRRAGSVSDRRSANYLPLAIGGAIAIWFSHPAAFVLAGLGLVLFGVAFWRSDEASIRGLIGVGMAWIVSFALCYVVCLRELSKNQYLMNYWTEYFAPLPPRNFEQVGWYLRAITGMFEGPGGMIVADVSVAMPAALLFGLGWLWLWRRTPVAASCLLAPMAVAMAASMLHRYPFGGRLLLFVVPLLNLGLGAAFAAVHVMPRSTGRTFLLVLCGAVMLAPLATAMQQLLRPRTPEDHRAIVGYIANHLKPGDGVLLSGMAREPWTYYAKQFGIDADVVGQVQRDDWDSVRDAVQEITGGKRVWVFVAHERDDNRKMLLWQLDQVGVRRAKFEASGAAAYLYDLSDPQFGN